MWPTDNVHQWRATVGSSPLPTGPAMSTLRSVVAPLASTIRSAGIVYIVVQVVDLAFLLHGRLVAIDGARHRDRVGGFRDRLPAPTLAFSVSRRCGLRLLCGAGPDRSGMRAAQRPRRRVQLACHQHVGQLIVPAWYAPLSLSALLTLVAPAAFWLGAVPSRLPTQDAGGGDDDLDRRRTRAHFSRRELYGRAEAADATLDAAAHAARANAVLARNIERREHERLCTTRSSTRSPPWRGPRSMIRPWS